MREIKIDFDNPGFPQRLDVVENDAQSRFFKAVLYKDGKAYTAPSGATYSIMYRGFGPQNEGWYDTINDGAGKRAACSVSGNVVTCEIARQALRVPGHVSVVLCVTGSNGYMLHGWPIDCNCRNDNYTGGTSVESFFYITQVTNADWTSAIKTWEELKNMIDPTLSLSGKAADAAKVGEAVGQIKEDLAESAKSNLAFLGVQKVVRGHYYFNRVFSKSDYYTWYFDTSLYKTNEYLVTVNAPGYTNFVTFLDEGMNPIGYKNNSSESSTVKEMHVVKPTSAKYIAATTSYGTPNDKNLSIRACISIEEIQSSPYYTNSTGEDSDISPLIMLKGYSTDGNYDSSYAPNTIKRAALYCPKSNCDIKFIGTGYEISINNTWQTETQISQQSTGKWYTIRNSSNTDFGDPPSDGESVRLIALNNSCFGALGEPYCIDITNKFTYNQAANNTIPFKPSNIRVVTSLFNPPQKATIMLSVPDTIDAIVEEFALKEDGTYIKKYLYNDFKANLGVWVSGTFYCNVYPERYYTIMIRNKDNSPISAGQVYKYLHVYVVDNRFHIPEYYRDYMSQKEKKILENIDSFNSFAFAFITDIHIQRNTKHSPALMRRIKTSCAIKTILGGGDWQTAWNSDEQGKNAIVDDMIEIRNLFFDLPMIKTIGNHEWAYGGNNQYNISTDEAYNIYYRSDEEKAKSEIVYSENGNGTYFYSDDKTNKIRYISVNCMDYADDLDISKYNKEWYFSISEEQIAWLKSSLNLPSNDWLCVVFSHVPLWTSSERPFGTSTLVVNAEKIGKVISGYTSKTEEFSAHKGTLVCWLAGHTHRDALIEWHGTHMVVTNADCFIRGEGAQTRTLGTTSEQCFDVFCINKKERNVKIVRIGAGENREFAY